MSDSDLLSHTGKPALRALAAAGYTRLDQLIGVSDADLLRLHGVGPKAVAAICEALGPMDASADPACRKTV